MTTVSSLRQTTSFGGAVGKALELLVQRLRLPAGVLARYDGEYLVVLHARSDPGAAVMGAALRPGMTLPWQESLCGLASCGPGPTVLPDIRDCEPFARLAEQLPQQVRSYVGVPLRSRDGHLLGSLCAYGPECRPDLVEEVDLPETLGALLAGLLEAELAADVLPVHPSTDALTGLWDRQSWDEAVAAVEQRCVALGAPAVVVALDVDGLASLNRTRGHDVGDATLAGVATVLRDVSRSLQHGFLQRLPGGSTPVLARTGGDEFALLVPDLPPGLVQPLVSEMSLRMREAGLPVSIGGGARRHGSGLLAAWHEADAQMLLDGRRRRAGRPQRSMPAPRVEQGGADLRSGTDLRSGADLSVVRDLALDAERHQVLSDLDALTRTGQPRIALQPVVALSAERTVGFECLARFDDGRGPQEWFSEANLAGGGVNLELAALENALALPVEVAPQLFVNLSSHAVASGRFQRRMAALVEQQPARLAQVVVELTEHQAVADYATIDVALRPWRARGLKLAIDDTGAGHSSLQHVLALRPDIVKLDRQLIAALDQDRVRLALVKALTTFCADIDVALVAEGVETAAELDALLALGMPYAQGFHLGRPALTSPQ